MAIVGTRTIIATEGGSILRANADTTMHRINEMVAKGQISSSSIRPRTRKVRRSRRR